MLRFVLGTLFMILVASLQSQGLRLIQVHGPTHAIVGRSANLKCDFSIDDGELLYSLKWFKDHEEFYRHVPGSVPSFQMFQVAGVEAQALNHNGSLMNLRNIKLSSAGIYRCEVNSEAPQFSTIMGETKLDVILLPSVGPHITGAESYYRVGEDIIVSCTSHKAKPAPKLSWKIGPRNIESSSKYLRHYMTQVDQEGLETATLGLEYTVREHDFDDNGQMILECTSNADSVDLPSESIGITKILWMRTVSYKVEGHEGGKDLDFGDAPRLLISLYGFITKFVA